MTAINHHKGTHSKAKEKEHATSQKHKKGIMPWENYRMLNLVGAQNMCVKVNGDDVCKIKY